MARSRTYTIDRFLGINEAPDGDTGLRLGEAAEMLNFRITAEGNLQIRPGYKSVATLADTHPVRGMWHGYVAGVERWLAACNGNVYSINLTTYAATSIGTLTDAPTCFFGFSDNVYILNGSQYKSWDGTTFGDVAGYAPVVTVNAAPATGTGTANEQVNKLTGSKWIWFSLTASDTIYHLPETNLTSVDTVKVNGAVVTAGFTVDLTAGTVTFSAAKSGVRIRYTKGTGTDRATILKQKFSEMYNGQTDNRIFLYGDGTNRAYYSGIEYESGLPTAEYFPDMNVLDVGESNTPITSMVRHFNKLFVQKRGGGTYLTGYDYITLEDGTVTAAFYTSAIEKEIGNDAPGQVRLVNNFPISLQSNSVYRWGLIYSSGTQDERAAKRISDRVRETLGGFDMTKAVTFDDEWNREYWIVENGKACVYQYANEAQGNTSYKQNVWCIYDNIPATCFVSIGGELYFGSSGGSIVHVSRDYYSDNGAAINACWKTGSNPFDAMQLRKYIRLIFVELKPEVGARVLLTAESDNRSDYESKTVSCGLATYEHFSYAHASYNTNYKPKTKRVKFKIKKFTHCKLILSSNSASATATVTALTIPVEYGSYAK